MTRRALVLVEPRDGQVPASQLGVVAAVRAVCSALEVVLPVAADTAADDLARLLGSHGADVVNVARGLPPTAPARTSLLAELHQQEPFDLVALESSSLAADVAGALAVRTGSGVCWDLVGLHAADGELRGRRLALGDSTIVETAWVSDLAIALFRTAALEPAEPAERADPVIRSAGPPGHAGPDITLLETGAESGPRSSGLDTAEVVVAGGRGLGSADNLVLLEELADVLGGVVAVSMPVVDRGWYPYENQVGQTGRTVRPRLYIACGISGAVQHRVGMSRSGTVVAINKDRDAPIFDICDLGVVGDLTEVVPRLTALLRDA